MARKWTEEQKKAASERAKARAAAKDTGLAEEHIGNFAVGFQRNEEMLRRADELADKQEREEKELGIGAIDPSKFKTIENEAGQKFDEETGSYRLSGRLPDYVYAWVTHEDGVRNSDAKGNVRTIHYQLRYPKDERGKTMPGWEYVEGDMPEGHEYIGKDHCAGTTRRGNMDTLLMRIRKDHLAAINRVQAWRQQRNGAVEDQFVFLGAQHLNRAGYGNTAHGSFNDPFMQKRFGGSGLDQPITTTVTLDQQIREGTIPGAEIRR